MSRRRAFPKLTRSVEIAVLAGIASLLIAVHFLLPDPLRSQLVFTYGEPSVVSAWTADPPR